MSVKYKEIPCGFCGCVISPTSSRQKHCSIRCRFLDIASKFHDVEGCWKWPLSIMGNGYGQLGGANKGAHRLSYEFFVGSIEHDKYVCHTCDNRWCFNPKHLFAGTPKENVQDMIEKGRDCKSKKRYCGDDHWSRKNPEKLHRKFSVDEEKQILSLSGKVSNREISRMFKCTHGTVARIIQKGIQQ